MQLDFGPWSFPGYAQSETEAPSPGVEWGPQPAVAEAFVVRGRPIACGNGVVVVAEVVGDIAVGFALGALRQRAERQ